MTPSLTEEARAHAAKITPPEAPARATAERWREWMTAARELRGPYVRKDRCGRWRPLSWREIAEWIRDRDPVARQLFTTETLGQELSVREREAKGLPKLTRNRRPPAPTAV